MSKKSLISKYSTGLSKYIEGSGMPIGAIPEYPKDFPSYSDVAYGVKAYGDKVIASTPLTGSTTIPMPSMVPPLITNSPPPIGYQYLIQLTRIADSLEKIVERFC